MQIKIVSLNLAGFKDWQSRQPKIVNFLNEVKPDALLLQEVKFDPEVSAYSQSMQLNNLLHEPFQFAQMTVSKFYQSSSGTTYREGLAVLSRFPITNSEVLALTKQPDDKHVRIVQNVDLVADGRTVGMSNIHLSNNRYSSEQLSELLGILKARGEQRIIAGDFNIFHLHEYRALYEDMYTASTEFKKYVSFPSEGHTFDYALIPQGFAFEDFEAHDGLSDHSALLFTVDIAIQNERA